MNKIIVGVFAHPDDEAFIVAGTLLQEVQAGAELHLICLTNGAAGTNPDKLADLGAARLQEWRNAGQLLGAKSMHYLGFQDGQLNNSAMIQATTKVKEIVQNLASSSAKPIEVIAFDTNGLTGHIDHIVATRAAALAFYQLKQANPQISKLRLACLPRQLYPNINTNWLYMESGRHKNEVDEIIDARAMREQILSVIHAHHSQRQDGESIIRTFGDQLGMNYFIVQQ